MHASVLLKSLSPLVTCLRFPEKSINIFTSFLIKFNLARCDQGNKIELFDRKKLSFRVSSCDMGGVGFAESFRSFVLLLPSCYSMYRTVYFVYLNSFRDIEGRKYNKAMARNGDFQHIDV